MDTNKLKLTELRPLKTLSLYDLLAKKRRENMQKHTEQTHYAKDQKNSERSSLKQTAQELKKKQ
jgi:hypothetical protein